PTPPTGCATKKRAPPFERSRSSASTMPCGVATSILVETWMRAWTRCSSPLMEPTRLSRPRRRPRGQRILGPGVARIAAHELAADRRVVPLPEAGEIGRHLHGALVGREQVQRERDAAARDAGALAQAEKILEAR